VPRPYAPEFRRRALDLLQTDRSVRDVAASLGIAESCLHHWKSRDLVDRGLKSPTPQQAESAALAAARARIAELETEVKILRKAAAAVEQVVPPKHESSSSLNLSSRTSRSSRPACPSASPDPASTRLAAVRLQRERFDRPG